MERGFVRKLPALVVAAGLLVALTACGGSPASNLANCVPEFDSGKASAQVDATGTFGKDPKASFPTPLYSKKIEVTQVKAGKGLPLYPGQLVNFQITAYNAKTGELLAASSYNKSQPVIRLIAAPTPGSQITDALGKLVQCATVGSRIVATTPVATVFGDQDLSSAGLSSKDTVVAIIDVQKGFLGKANGVDQLPQAGFPAIALAPDGQPGLTVPKTDPPSKLQHEVLKAGGGAVVKTGDSVVLQFTSMIWGEKSTVDSTWDKGTPIITKAGAAGDADNGIAPGFASALIGQKVGSQVVVIIPPADGYAQGSAPASVPAGSTLIYVFDILGIE